MISKQPHYGYNTLEGTTWVFQIVRWPRSFRVYITTKNKKRWLRDLAQ